jgi:hypothetical protein
MVGGYLRVLRFLPLLKLVAMILYTYGLVRRWKSRIINPSKVISLRVDNSGYPPPNQAVNVL